MSPTFIRQILPILFIAGVAGAQGFELNLTEEKPEAAPVELRPSLAVVSVRAADGEEVSASRARQLETELFRQLAQGTLFQTAVDPATAKQGLGADFGKAEVCVDFACLEQAAQTLKVNRLLRLTVAKRGVGSVVTAYGYDPGFNEVLVISQDSEEKAEKVFLGVAGKSQAQKDREFLKKIGPFLLQLQKKLSTPNGKIVVDNADPSAVVTVDGHEAGIGSAEIIVQPGVRKVKVTSPGYVPFEQTVTVPSAKAIEVKVSLVALPIEPVVTIKAVEEPKGSLFLKPAFYLAVAGGAAMAVGLGFGLSAQGVKAKLEAGGDPVRVTRAEAKVAPTNAMVANVLVGVGAAAVAGGVTWMALAPTPPAPASPPVPKTGTGEPTETTTPGPTGAIFSVGGSF